MVSTAPELAAEELIIKRLALDKYEPEPSLVIGNAVERPPKTASEWFSKRFPQAAQIHGCPFLELKEICSNGYTKINPLAPNIDFLAGVLGGDARMGHKVIYLENESQFYFYDVRANIFRPTTSEKLGNLLRAILMRCAEELPDTVHKFSLFQEFRSDKTIKAIVHRAKSILAADHTFFTPYSKNAREKGPEIHERLARVFVEQMLERRPEQVLTLSTAYLVFTEFLKLKEMAPVKRSDFKSMLAPLVREIFNLGLRNDVIDQATQKQTAGWKGLSAQEREQAVKS